MARIILSITALLFALTGCVPAPEPASNVAPKSSARAGGHDVLHVAQEANGLEITTEKIMSDIVGRVVKTAASTGTEPPTDWTFEASEFRQVEILDRHMEDTRFTIIIFITTRNNHQPDEDDVQVSGKLRLYYERKGSQWILTAIDNLTFRYTVGQST
jgi:hypothetical protein